MSQFPAFAKDVMGGDETVVTLFLTMFSIGIGIGSALCNVLLRGEVSSRHVPYAAFGITVFVVDLFFASPSGGVAAGETMNAWHFIASPLHWRVLFDLLAAAICAGVYIVPLYAIMQHDSDPQFRARTIASNNVINALFMVTSAVATMLMLKAAFSVLQVFLAAGLLNAVFAVYLARVLK